MKNIKCALIIGVLTLGVWAEKTELSIGGSGSSTGITTILAGEFSKVNPGYVITVPQLSIKHSGGMKWAMEQDQVFGRLGRKLNADDLAKYPNARFLPVARMLVGFAVNKTAGVTHLTAAQFEDICLKKVTNWSQIGGADIPIIVLGREKTESSVIALEAYYPFFKDIQIDKEFKSDDLMVANIRDIPGSIGYSTVSVLQPAKDIPQIAIEGLECTLDAGLVYEAAREDSEPVKLMKAFVKSEAWLNTIKQNTAYLPSDPWKKGLDYPVIQKIEVVTDKLDGVFGPQAADNGMAELAKQVAAGAEEKTLTGLLEKMGQQSPGPAKSILVCDGAGKVLAAWPQAAEKPAAPAAATMKNLSENRIVLYSTETFSYGITLKSEEKPCGMLILSIEIK